MDFIGISLQWKAKNIIYKINKNFLGWKIHYQEKRKNSFEWKFIKINVQRKKEKKKKCLYAKKF